jgi:apolipoprotein N-acyltransferase
MMPLFPLLFVGFTVPFLLIEYGILYNKRSPWFAWGLLYTFLLVWNASTTWWICNVQLVAGLFANVANAALMTIPLMFGRYVWLKAGRQLGYITLLTLWLGFEYVHLNWELTWAWLTLGNGLAVYPSFIQWYSITGTMGGSLWILITSLFGYHFILRTWFFGRVNPAAVSYVYFILLIGLPITYSYWEYSRSEPLSPELEVVAIQPNIDPLQEKFEGSPDFIPLGVQVDRLKQLSEQVITPSSRFLLWPETSFDTESSIWEENIDQMAEIVDLKEWLRENPNLVLITGATTFVSYTKKDLATATARYHNQVGYYDVFNSALRVEPDKPVEIYHKSKLVPGVERMPYPAVFRLLESLVIDLGGASGSLGTQKEREIFCAQNADTLCTTPCICYESIFGEFMGQGVQMGADFISIITNDGWWGNSPGHRQHAAYASILAISHHRAIARSANTGISCFVNPKGDRSQMTAYGVPAALVGKVSLQKKQTYYTAHGDYIGRLAGFLGIFLFLSVVVKHRTTRAALKPKQSQ